MQATMKSPNRSIKEIIPEWVSVTGIAFAALMANLGLLVKMAL